MPEAVWAYDFACNLSLDAIQTAFNAAGSWQWRPQAPGQPGKECRRSALEPDLPIATATATTSSAGPNHMEGLGNTGSAQCMNIPEMGFSSWTVSVLSAVTKLSLKSVHKARSHGSRSRWCFVVCSGRSKPRA